MAGRDGTGPSGQGPMTGGGFGNCTPRGAGQGQGFGRGQGRGFSRGFGQGFGRDRGFRLGRFFNQNQLNIDEKTDLKDYVKELELELQDAKKALDESNDEKKDAGKK